MADNDSATVLDAESANTCAQLNLVFVQINQYFRDEDGIPGTEHSSVFFGNLIILVYSVVIVFGALGNLLTITAIVTNSQMRTVRNFFILNLALSDFFICTVTAPITLYTVLNVFWPFGTTACKIAGSLQGFNIFLSTFSITAIAFDRYVLVIFPTQRQRQHNLSLFFFLVIWLISIVFALPLFTASDSRLIFENAECNIKLSICHEQNERWTQMIINKEVYTLAVMVTQYAFPLASIVFAYSRIAYRMRMRFAARNSLCSNVQTTVGNTRRKSMVEQRQRRTNLLLICLVVVFATAWLPLNVFHVVNTFGWRTTFSVPAFALCHAMAVTSACLNPLSYAFFNQNFRQEFADMLKQTKLIWLYESACSFLTATIVPQSQEGRHNSYRASIIFETETHANNCLIPHVTTAITNENSQIMQNLPTQCNNV